MASKTIAVSILADTKELQANLSKAEGSLGSFAQEADQSADKARLSLDGVAEASDHTASAASQAAGGLGDLGGALSLMPGPLGAVGTGMEALAPAIMGVTGASDLLNLVTEKLRINKLKDIVVTKAKLVAEKAGAVATKAMAIAQGALNAVMSANPIALVVIAIIALVAAFIVAYKKSETFRKIVNAAFDGIKKVISAVVGWFKQWVPQAFQIVKTAITTYVKAYLTVIKTVFNIIKNVIKTVITVVKAIIKTAFKVIKTVFNTYVRAWLTIVKTVFGLIKTAIRTALEVIKTVIRTALNVIKTVFKTVWTGIKSALSGVWGGIKDVVRNGVGGIVDLIRSIPGKIADLGSKFLSAGKTLIGKFFDGLKAVGSIGANIASTLMNPIIDGINSAIVQINGAIPNSLGIGKFSINLPDNPFPTIRHLATGGITTGPMLAVIGDNPGGREAVIPLDKYDPFGSKNVNVTVVAPVGSSSKDIGRELEKHLTAWFRSNGGRAAWT